MNKRKLVDIISSRKILGTFIGFLVYLLCILFFTYAFYSWRSSNSVVDLSISDSDSDSGLCEIEMLDKTEVNASNIGPVLDYNDGEVSTFKVKNTTNNIVAVKVYQDILEISETLKVESFKYKLLRDSTGGTNFTEIASGNYSDFVTGNNEILENETIAGNATYNYKFIVYIDGNEKNNINMQVTNLKSNIIFMCSMDSFLLMFDANGGEVDTLEKKVTLNSTYGDLPTPTRTSYEFQGWYTEREGGVQITSSSVATSLGGQVLYARWNLLSYTVTFNANGGSVSTSSKTVIYNETYGDLPTPTKTGYTFDGWYTEETGGTKITSDSIVAVTANQTLYAHWTANTYTITYDSGNLIYGLSNVSNVTNVNMTYSVSNGVVTVTGKTDDGYGVTNGRVYLEANKTYVFSCVTNGTWGGGVGDSTVEAYLLLDGAYNTLYRMGSIKHSFTPTVSGTYHLRLDVNKNGGTATFSDIIIREVSSVNRQYDSTYGTMPTPTRTGYTFNGWYTAASGGTKVTSSTTVSITANQTLYAHWTGKTYTLYASPDNGTISATSGWTQVGTSTLWKKTVTYDSTYGTLPTITRSGYTLNGWYSSLSYGTLTMASKTSNYNYSPIIWAVKPGVTYKITMTKATVTAGSASTFTAAIYDTTTSTVLTSTTASYGSNVSLSLTCPDTATETNDIRIIIYAGLSGSTSGIAATYTGIVVNTTDITAGTKMTTSTTVSTPRNHVIYARWTAINFLTSSLWTMKHDNYSASFDANGSTMTLNAHGANESLIYSNSKYDLTNVQQIVFTISEVGAPGASSSYTWLGIGVSSSDQTSFLNSYNIASGTCSSPLSACVGYSAYAGGSTNITLTLNVANLTGSYYIKIGMRREVEYYNGNLVISNIKMT